jgi:hypothetical protein
LRTGAASGCGAIFRERLDPARSQAEKWRSERIMWTVLEKIPYALLIGISVFMLLAPFRPMPHVLEKLMMLKNGTLNRPIDIFDLFYHLIPLALLLLKIYRDVTR